MAGTPASSRSSGGLAWDDIHPVGIAVSVDVFRALTNTNWNGLTTASSVASAVGTRESSGAQDAEVTFTAVLGPGTWTMHLLAITANNLGIITVRVNGATEGTIDQYSAAFTGNVRSTVTDIVIAAGGAQTVNLKMETKNASSSSFFGELGVVTFVRTA